MFKEEKEFEEMIERLNINTKPNPIHRRNVRNKMLSAFNETSQKYTTPLDVFRRTIMKNTITKIAAAAVLIFGVLVGMHYMGNPFVATVTFADVIEPILNAQTAEFDIIMGEDEQGPVIHDMVKGSRIRRTMSNMEDDIIIIDLEAGRILTINISKKEAAYVDLKGLPSIPNYMEVLKNLIAMLQESPDFTVEELGEQEIQGRSLIGFRANHPRAEITIWADPQTALPIQIEQIEPQLKVVCKNMEFDRQMDDALFSMDVPDGFQLQQVELDLMGSTEQDFVEGLRVRAEVFGNGLFPESVAVEDYIKEAPTLEKKMEELGLSDKEEMELGMKLSRHLLFIRFFKGQGQWHYAGNGVKLGDSNAPIFWYQPEGSDTYRVIYGDLSVQDVVPEDLPE